MGSTLKKILQNDINAISNISHTSISGWHDSLSTIQLVTSLAYTLATRVENNLQESDGTSKIQP